MSILALMALAAQATPYTIVGQTTAQTALIERTTWTVQPGADPVDQFTVRRVRSVLAPTADPVILMPPLGNNADFYELSPWGLPNAGVASNLARAGYDVYLYSPRSTGLTAADCLGPVDCTAIGGWGLSTTIDDVGIVRDLVASSHPTSRPAIGGYSLGAVTAMAAIDDDPTAFSAAMFLEGTLVTSDPALQAHNQGLCDVLTAMGAAGITYNADANPGLQALVGLAAAAPDDPSPVPGFPPGTTNQQAVVLALGTPSAVNPGSVHPSYVVAASTVDYPNEFDTASMARLQASMVAFDELFAIGDLRDTHCSLAGDPTFTSDLDQFAGPVLALSAGHGFGPVMAEVPGVMAGSGQVTTVDYPDMGHIDPMLHPFAFLAVDLPVAQFLDQVTF